MKQHWVPRSYLAAWADAETADRDNPLVWAFNVEERRLFHPSVKSIFAETHMYSVTKADGSKDVSLEARLSKLEGAFAEARHRYEGGAEPTPEDEGLFAVYAGVMHARSQYIRDHHRGQWQQVLDRMNELEDRIQKHGAPAFSRVESAREGATIGREGVEHAVENTAALILPIIAKVEAGVYARMNRATLIVTGNDSFITSDRPCAWLDSKPSERGFWQASPLMSESLEVYLPISPRRCFIWSHDRRLVGDIEIGDSNVRMMNLWLAAHSSILVRERPLFEKAFCDNPRMARMIAGIYTHAD